MAGSYLWFITPQIGTIANYLSQTPYNINFILTRNYNNALFNCHFVHTILTDGGKTVNLLFERTLNNSEH